MPEIIKAPRGTLDILPKQSYVNHYIENKLFEICERFGYKEIRVPTFEHTELFLRGVGDTTDIVGKEMYTFFDKSERSITLRPEGTAGVVRAFLEHGSLNETLPLRAYYNLSCFRYEKPQAGRLREFHQLGIETFGAQTPDADCEVIAVGNTIFKELGLREVSLEINSIGCPECRPKYHEALKEYFSSKKGDLCATCVDRLERNPLRILDCKSPVCSEIAKGAPIGLDYLCEQCGDHFEQLKQLLTKRKISFTINTRIVRGLDYYTKTVFEFVHKGAGAQGTVCGGGRYDGLVSMLGGNAVPGIGFGMGLERLVSVLQSEGVEIPLPQGFDIFICYIGQNALEKARQLCFELQDKGISAGYDINDRGLKAQMKFADKSNSFTSLVIGDDEILNNSGTLKTMGTKNETSVLLETDEIINAIEKFKENI